jgi:hypothetical protein
VKVLDKSFPFRDIFMQFLKEYSESTTYWYVPKWRVIDDKNINEMTQIIKVIFKEFLGYVWNVGTQDKILNRLTKLKIFRPYKEKGKKADRAALTRICKKLLETLGLLWVQNGKEIVITDAGLDLLSAKKNERRAVIERQIIKYQYPNPSLKEAHAGGFLGILPHIFLLQILRKCGNQITSVEYELFVNLAKSQEDTNRIVKYIESWRDINEQKRKIILNKIRQITIPGKKQTRFKRISQDASYQKAFFAFPSYVKVNAGGKIVCTAPAKANEQLSKLLPSLKITKFKTLEDWFAYFGDPKKEPSWLTYLITVIRDASTIKEAKEAIRKHRKKLLTPEDNEVVKIAQIEKDIETLYCSHPEKIEKGLVVENRQFPTPIGRIDILCKSQKDEYVVVEIKADEARDSVFGQILRYIGWIHRNIDGARDNVRGIIVASKFPENAYYSRIGLLKPDYEKFLQFHPYTL